MLTQKLYRNGNSVAVTIPKEYLIQLNLKDGAEVMVKKVGKDIVVTPKKDSRISGINTKFAKMVEEFIDEHEDVLRELAQN